MCVCVCVCVCVYVCCVVLFFVVGILPPFVVDFVCCLLLAIPTRGRLSPTIRHTLSLSLPS